MLVLAAVTVFEGVRAFLYFKIHVIFIDAMRIASYVVINANT